MKPPATRNTIFPELAAIIEHIPCPGQQYHLHLQAPLTSAHAKPGTFVHLQCAPLLPMRRPMSIMRSNAGEQTIDVLYKAHGKGANLLTRKKKGETIDLLGPIGAPFKLSGYRKHPLLLGGGVGIPPMIFLAEHIKNTTANTWPLALMGSEVPFPFKPRPSQILVPGIPKDVIACMPLLDSWGIASRLSSLQQYGGCYQGYVTDLARRWLQDRQQHQDVELFACGPVAMLQAVAKLAQEYRLPCQICIEEYMACAVGGCAGCIVPVHTDAGIAMQRVCVDGPVFEANAVYPGKAPAA